MRRLLALAALAALTACAGAVSQQVQANRGAYADFLIGRVAKLRDDHTGAADRYFAALEKAPATPELLEGALNATLAGGDARRARAAARMARERRADLALARIVRAVDALEGRRWSEARSELRDLNGDGVELLTARFISIWAQAGEGHTDEAVAELGMISADWRQISGIVDYQRAMTLDLAGRREEAAAAYEVARGSRLWVPPAAVREADLLARMRRGSTVRALYGDDLDDPAFSRAIAAAEAGRPVARSPLTAARGAAIGLYGLGALLVEENDYARGLSLLTLSLMLDPGLDVARLKFAEGQRDLGHPHVARAALEAIEPTSPYAETARISSAWLLRREDRNDEAIAVARNAAESGGRDARVALGDLYRSLERWQDADAAYTAVIDSRNPAQASDWFLFFARAVARERMGRWEAAQTDVRRALELSPDQPEALNFLGYGWIDRGENLAEGLGMIQRAVALRPRSGHIIDSLGWAYFRMGDFQQALGYLERAVELEPGDVTLNDHLGDVFWRLGRRLEARYQWNRALSLGPSANERAAIEAKLSNGLAPVEPSASAAR